MGISPIIKVMEYLQSCKVMEKLLRDVIVDHLQNEKLLSPKQYGFITGRSTVTQLLFYLDECIKTVADGGVVDSVYLDFSKAFLTLSHTADS